MSRTGTLFNRIDVVLVILSIVILIGAFWIWIVALPIAREIVFLVTTIALVISIVLILNMAVLVILRLQRRVTHLEQAISEGKTIAMEDIEEKVIVVTLTNTERRIINRLEEGGGEMTQDELRRVTGLSKSTLSVTLSTLERKSLVSRQTSGRTKIVRLEKSIPR